MTFTRTPSTYNITSIHPLISRGEARRIFRFYSTFVFKAAATFLKSIPSRLGLGQVSVSSILSQHGVKLSNFSWAVWRKIIYRFLLLRHCILSSWKSVILIIYQNKRNPKQILNISRHGRLVARWYHYWDSWLAKLYEVSSSSRLGDCCVVRWRVADVLSWTHVYTLRSPHSTALYLWSR